MMVLVTMDMRLTTTGMVLVMVVVVVVMKTVTTTITMILLSRRTLTQHASYPTASYCTYPTLMARSASEMESSRNVGR